MPVISEKLLLFIILTLTVSEISSQSILFSMIPYLSQFLCLKVEGVMMLKMMEHSQKKGGEINLRRFSESGFKK